MYGNIDTLHYCSLQPFVLDRKMLLKSQQDTGDRKNLPIVSNSCFSDLSDSINSQNFRSIEGKLYWLSVSLNEHRCKCSQLQKEILSIEFSLNVFFESAHLND